MGQKKSNSTHIVEAKVVRKESFRHDENIYTKNYLEIIRSIKGDAMKGAILTIVTSGGKLESEIQTWTHMPVLYEGQTEFFFLAFH